MEIILRHCGRVGWIGIIIAGGKETYRTGIHYPSTQEALDQVRKFMEAAV